MFNICQTGAVQKVPPLLCPAERPFYYLAEPPFFVLPISPSFILPSDSEASLTSFGTASHKTLRSGRRPIRHFVRDGVPHHFARDGVPREPLPLRLGAIKKGARGDKKRGFGAT